MIDKSFQALTLSLLIHGLVLWLFGHLPSRYETIPAGRRPIEIQVMSPADKSKQSFVTETEKQDLLEQLKDKANYLSKLSKRVKEQMRARNSGETRNRSGVALTNDDEARSRGNGGERLQARRELPSVRDLGNGPRAGEMQGSGPFGRQVVIGASTVGEYIPGVKEGAFTALNTDRFTYYSFFSRINDQVRPRWISAIRDFADRLPIQALAELSRIERVTEIEIVLDRSGDFLKSYVYKSSGYRDLDEAAVAAFRQAAPFPNPPQEMAESDGAIHLHYGFVVQWQPHHLAVGK